MQEEQLIIDCLSQYKCLKQEQLIQLIHYKPRELVEKILNGLTKRQMLIVDTYTENVKHDPRCDYNYKTEIAFWILLKYIKIIKPSEHYAASYPSQIYFLKEKNQYEIIVLQTDEDYLLGPLSRTERASGEEDDETDEMRYIVAIPSESMIPVCKSRLKGFKVLFAIYDPEATPGRDPNIRFITT